MSENPRTFCDFSVSGDKSCDAGAPSPESTGPSDDDSQETLHLTEALDPELWEYLGEGNANIVFRAKVSHPKIQHTFHRDQVVLRLRKASSSHGTAHDSLHFLERVVKPLFPSHHLPHFRLLSVTRAFLRAMQDRVEGVPHRAPSRRADVLDLTQPCGMLAPDYTACGTVCIEIKPKWLVAPPRPPRLEAEDEAEDTAVAGCRGRCRFCLHQQLKAARTPAMPGQPGGGGTLWTPTRFCPLDLLTVATLPRAVSGLLDAPNNNLRLWHAGRPVHLTAVATPDRGAWHTCLVAVLAHLQPLFHALAAHQTRLDTHALPLTARANPADPSHACVPTTRQAWQRLAQTYSTGQAHGTDPLLAYALSKTLKDCSILVTLAALDAPQPLECVLLDLDPKPVHKWNTWVAFEQQILSMLPKDGAGMEGMDHGC